MRVWHHWMMGFLLVAAVGLMAPGVAVADSAETCLARTVYFEARGDGEEGMAAVAAVVMNRVAHAEFPGDPCAVVKEGGESPPCQFTYWCDGRSDRPEDQELWALAREVAGRALRGELGEPVGDALFFHNTSIESPFGDRREHVATVGQHLFYR